MRIRKRPMLPFSLSSSPRMPSDLFSPRWATVQKPAEGEKGCKEEGAAAGEGVFRGDEGEGQRKGGLDQQIGSCGSFTGCEGGLSENKPSLPRACDRIRDECSDGEKDRCTLTAPILAPMEASRDAQEERWSAREKGNSGSGDHNTGTLDAETSTAAGRTWEEREKAVPPKKRKGNFEWGGEATATETQKKMKTKVKKMTKKRHRGPEATSVAASGVSSGGAKKGRRGCGGGGGVLMEGSRCSRINGRGWRCCQQTLVGYSLCEHHLGKGRLRSMNSLRGRAAAAARPSPDQTPDDNEGPVPPTGTKSAAKKKIGMVKARSISSLLSLATTAVLSTDDDLASASVVTADDETPNTS